MGHSGPKRGQGMILGHFFGQYALVFAGFAYYDELLCLVADVMAKVLKTRWP